MVELVGLLAGLMTTLSFVPQVVRTLRTRLAGDLSLGMLVIFNLGVVFWLAYGVLLGAAPIIATNAVTLCLAGFLLVWKLAEHRGRPAVQSVRQPL